MKTPLLRGTLIELSPWHDNPAAPAGSIGRRKLRFGVRTAKPSIFTGGTLPTTGG